MNFTRKKSSVLFVVTAFLLLLMSSAAFYSIYVTNTISSDAMVINKLGSVRGSMQRIVKLELNGQHCDQLIERVDDTLNEFETREIRLFDHNNEIMSEINIVEDSWDQVKAAIYEFRKTINEETRLNLQRVSEDAWYKANSMVFASQASSENKISKYRLSFLAFFLNILLSIVIIVLIKKYVKDSLEEMVHYDSLTGALNRRFFSDFLHGEIIRAERYNRSFSLIMLDIDHFKKVNDVYGHDVGDKLLQQLKILVCSSIRKTDVFARIGGEEFAIIAPETTLNEAVQLAEKVRTSVQEGVFVSVLKITVSFGVAEYQSKDDDNSIYKRADTALYKAKSNGRNRVEICTASDAVQE